MNGPKRAIEKDVDGKTTKLAVDADVFVMTSGESLEEQAIVLLGAETHDLPVNLAEMLAEHFDSYQGQAGPVYGRLRITIERGEE